MSDTKLTNRLREFRFMAGEMTQKELADRVGVSRQTIISIEKSRYSPTLELAFRIAEVFGARVDEVFSLPPQ